MVDFQNEVQCHIRSLQVSRQVARPSAFTRTSCSWRGADVTSSYFYACKRIWSVGYVATLCKYQLFSAMWIHRFIFWIFNDAVSNSECIASIGRMI